MAGTAILPSKRPAGEPPPQINPRRTTPEASISLPTYKKRKLDSNSDHGHTKAHASTSTARKSSSQESASKWFEHANENVSQQQATVARSDSDDTPFFMSKQPAYLPGGLVSTDSDESFGSQHRDDSENADLRGVIDDLTIENKRLKQLLRHSRNRDSPNNQDQDKLFEIRVHGLSAPWKRELEHLLKTFTTNVHTSISSRPDSAGTVQVSPMNSGVTPGNKTAKSQAIQTDSGYGSNSNSNSNSNSTLPSIRALGGGKLDSELPKVSNRSKSIIDYLHNIPDTLRPRRVPAMTERTKMLLVVRRLEQLFTGKSAAPGGHSQTIQQQKVSQSAAKADRSDTTKVKKVRYQEGSREALMFSRDTKVNLDAPERSASRSNKYAKDDVAPTTTQIDKPSNESKSDVSPEASVSPDQRPTRPLDLDINRAQVVAENVDYIRHLGFSPHLDTEEQLQEDCWLYINLLSSMAQLHTLNVTPSFIRKAVKKLSTKFELSKDGHKARWIGGNTATVFSKEDEQAIDAVTDVQAEPVEDSGPSGSNRSQTTSSSFRQNSSTEFPEKASNPQTSDTSQQPKTTVTSQNPFQSLVTESKLRSAFDYKPIVFNPQKFNPRTAYLDSPSLDGSTGGDSSGLANALSKSSLDHRHNNEDGTITFFNNPFFYKDASFDLNPTNWKSNPSDVMWPTIGLSDETEGKESLLRHHDACYFTPQFAPKPYRSRGTEPELDFPVEKITSAGEDETQPLEFCASGIGGTVPAENFILDVKINRSLAKARKILPTRRIPFTGSKKQQRFTYSTAKCQKIDLLPSRLPPPTYIFFTSSSSSDISDDDKEVSESESSSSPEREDFPALAGFLHQWSNGTSSYEGDESSMDRLQPEAIADPRGHQTQTSAEQIDPRPPQAIENVIEGSLAATVGASKGSSVVSEVSESSDGSGSEEDSSDDEMEVDE